MYTLHSTELKTCLFLLQECPDAAIEAVVEMVRGLSAQQRAQVLQSLHNEDQQS